MSGLLASKCCHIERSCPKAISHFHSQLILQGRVQTVYLLSSSSIILLCASALYHNICWLVFFAICLQLLGWDEQKFSQDVYRTQQSYLLDAVHSMFLYPEQHQIISAPKTPIGITLVTVCHTLLISTSN